MAGHYGTTTAGEDYEIEVSRGVHFRCYAELGAMSWSEVNADDGRVSWLRVPDELDPRAARAFAALLMDAADEAEKQIGGTP
jgi:hypothetical protein